MREEGRGLECREEEPRAARVSRDSDPLPVARDVGSLPCVAYFAKFTMTTPASAMAPPRMAMSPGTSPSQRKPSKVEIGGTL